MVRDAHRSAGRRAMRRPKLELARAKQWARPRIDHRSLRRDRIDSHRKSNASGYPVSAGSLQSLKYTNLRSPQAHEFEFPIDRLAVRKATLPRLLWLWLSQSQSLLPLHCLRIKLDRTTSIQVDIIDRKASCGLAMQDDSWTAQQTNKPSTVQAQGDYYLTDPSCMGSCSPPSSCHDSTGLNKAVWKPTNLEINIEYSTE